MKTSIVHDDDLLKDLLARTDSPQQEAVELALQPPVKLKRQENIKALKGQLHWTGKLNEMQRDADNQVFAKDS